MSRRSIFTWMFVIPGLLGLPACQVEHHRVVAVSGTVIGLSIGQNPQTRFVEGTLGYRRGELALVPTNRVADGAHNGGGASESAEVLMEIQQADLFSARGSIYQRLAVGPNAVKQAGAAFLRTKELEELEKLTGSDAEKNKPAP